MGLDFFFLISGPEMLFLAFGELGWKGRKGFLEVLFGSTFFFFP